jgi:hypothetical protein
MENVTRPDGSRYIRSTRVIYGAVGWVPPERRAEVAAALRALPEPVAGLIREFEAIVQAPSHPRVEAGVRTAAHPDNIGLFSAGPFRCEEAAEVADRVASALGDLLRSLGAVDVIWTNVD